MKISPHDTHQSRHFRQVLLAVLAMALALFASSSSLAFADKGQAVANAPSPTGVFCNTGAIATPSSGAAQLYPSPVSVAGLSGVVTKVTATLMGVTHPIPIDFDVLLSGPDPAKNLILLSDAGGQTQVSNIDLTFDDAATDLVPAPPVSGTFRPTNTTDGSYDDFIKPAPSVSGATALSTFAGMKPNGDWNLWVVDDASGDLGVIAGGWCLTITTTAPTSTALSGAPSPSAAGQVVDFTATVNSGGTPVTTGTVQFYDGATPLGSPVTVALDGSATLSTAALPPGERTVTAAYSGSASHDGSVGSLVHGVRPVAAAGGPYTTAEGGGVTLDGSGSTAGANYAWDLDGDGVFTDATGVSPSLTWAQLEGLGINDGPSDHDVTIRVSLGSLVSTSTSRLHVANKAPVSVVTGSRTAVVGTPFTVKLGADDPSSVDLGALFTYTVDWGDGSPIETLSGPADPPVTHTYATAGTFSASMTATDKDGGVGAPTIVQVLVATPALTPTVPPVGSAPSPPAPPTASPAGLPATGSPTVSGPVGLAVLLFAAGSLLIAGSRRRRRTPGGQ